MRAVPAEFVIDEQPLPVDLPAETRLPEAWKLIGEQVTAAAQQVRALQESLRTTREQGDEAQGKLLLEIIEQVMDNLDRIAWAEEAREGPPDPTVVKWTKRIAATRRTLEKLFAQEHAVPLDLVSAPPGTVEVYGTELRDDVPEGSIVQVIRRGWLWRGAVLRKSRVIVAEHSPSP
jgi:molecular chaperone GrpE (heat shock protein)